MRLKLLSFLLFALCFYKIHAQSFIDNNINYHILTTGGLVASDYNEAGGTSVSIPDSVIYNGTVYNVTHISNAAFAYNNLVDVTIGNNVTTIHDNAFFGNSITNLTIGNSVESIGENAFYQSSLTSVNIPNSVISIGNYAFYQNSLTSVVLGNSIETIGISSFYDNNLQNVIIPETVTIIKSYAFAYNEISNIEIPDSVTDIGSFAFTNNKLIYASIGNSINTLNDYVFYENSLLTTVISKSTNPTALLSNVFDDTSIIDLKIPPGVSLEYTNLGWTGFKSITEDTSLNFYAFTKNNKVSINLDNKILNIITDNLVTNIEIYTLTGTLVKSVYQKKVNIGSLSNGVYIVRVHISNEIIATKKIIINH